MATWLLYRLYYQALPAANLLLRNLLLRNLLLPSTCN
jgi:hypothetical protein